MVVLIFLNYFLFEFQFVAFFNELQPARECKMLMINLASENVKQLLYLLPVAKK